MRRAEDSGQADVEDFYLYDLFIEDNVDIKMYGDTLAAFFSPQT